MIPKYRAWDVHNKKMFTESELVIWHGNVYANDYQKLFKKFIEGARGLVGYSIDDKYLMQSTGLFDKNGKEIFEGDVVKFNDTWDEYCCEGYVDGCSEGENFAEIIKTADGWGFGKTKFPDSSLFYFLEEERMTFSEIVESNDFNMAAIGNNYDNPELLEEVE